MTRIITTPVEMSLLSGKVSQGPTWHVYIYIPTDNSKVVIHSKIVIPYPCIL